MHTFNTKYLISRTMQKIRKSDMYSSEQYKFSKSQNLLRFCAAQTIRYSKLKFNTLLEFNIVHTRCVRHIGLLS
jgi:hypothetical protein